MDREVLKWFGHVERMSGEWLTKRENECEVGVKGAEEVAIRVRKQCSAGLLELSDVKVKCLDIEQWRDSMNCTNTGMNV